MEKQSQTEASRCLQSAPQRRARRWSESSDCQDFLRRTLRVFRNRKGNTLLKRILVNEQMRIPEAGVHNGKLRARRMRCDGSGST